MQGAFQQYAGRPVNRVHKDLESYRRRVSCYFGCQGIDPESRLLTSSCGSDSRRHRGSGIFTLPKYQPILANQLLYARLKHEVCSFFKGVC